MLGLANPNGEAMIFCHKTKHQDPRASPVVYGLNAAPVLEFIWQVSLPRIALSRRMQRVRTES